MPHPYRLDDAGQAAVEQAAGIARDIAGPNAAHVDQAARFPKEAISGLGKQGFFGLCLPAEVGGKGLGLRAYAAVVEELATQCASTAMVYVMHVTSAAAIASSNVLKNRQAILNDIAAGKHLSTLAFSEKGSRSNFWAPVSRLETQGDGLVTNAFKSWVTSADHADSYVSSGQMPNAESPLQSTVYLVPRGAAGRKIQGGFDGLGLRGNDSRPVAYENLRVSNDDLISAQGEGAGTMLGVVLPWFVVGTSAMAHGLCRGSIDATAGHLSNAGFDFNGTKLRDLPNLRARLARMSVRTEQSRALLGYTLDHMESGSEAAALYVLQARRSALETATEVTGLAMKACGGAAFSKHLPLERLFRDAQAGWVMAPTVDHLDDFIGKALTGLPLF